MKSRSLQVLLVAEEGESTVRLAELLESCSNPVMDVTSTSSVEDASLVASSRDVDVVVLHAALAPDIELGVLRLPSILLTVPVVIAQDSTSDAPASGAPPEGVADYLVPDRDPPHVVERLLTFASQRHAMFRTLREAESQLRAIVEGISDGVMILDERDEVLYANPAVEHILDRPLFAMLGAPSPIVTPANSPTVVEYEGSGDEQSFLRVSAIPILWERRHAHLVTVQDITAERAIQENLEQARDEAERIAALKTSFLANMSHELRMPLASIIGYAQIIKDGSEVEEHTEFASSIVDSGNRLLETITSILDLTRLDAQAVHAETRPVSLTAVILEATGMLSALATRKGLEMEIGEADRDDTVVTDPSVLRRIIANLVGNAIKFTDEGGVKVRIEMKDEEAIVRVSDTGKGIGEEFLPHLFDEFTQESSGFGRSHEGSGLGLAIASRLCDLIGARIGVITIPDEGSTFSVAIPLTGTRTD